MHGAGELSRVRGFLRAAVLMLFAAGTVGCSSEVTRLDPYANPYAAKSAPKGDLSGSVVVPAAPAGHIETQPLPQPQMAQPLPPYQTAQPLPPYPTAQPLPPYQTAQPLPPYQMTQPPPPYQMTQPLPPYQMAQPLRQPQPPMVQPLPPAPIVSPTGAAGGAQGMGSYAPTGVDVTGSVVNGKPAPAQPKWSWNGGTAILVAPGETVDTLSRKYGVPAAAIMQANNISGPTALQPGQRVIIPRFDGGGTIAAAPPPTAVKPTSIAAGGAGPAPHSSSARRVHVVAPGETLTSIARRYRKPVTEIAAANRIAPHTLVKMGDKIVVPGVAPAAAKPAAAKTAAPAAAPAAPQKVATTEPAPSIRMATSAPDTRNEANTAAAEPMGAAPSFRWPVRGRVITAFGAKTNGQQNDGINLAVPEGTAVRAAEDGVVAYAGNELKGYGNLILVRHANGFVTAYAHASEISVKRGDQVRRGQVIAKSGQTGTVTSPQLHFEIRKGSSPVDPMQHLPGA